MLGARVPVPKSSCGVTVSLLLALLCETMTRYLGLGNNKWTTGELPTTLGALTKLTCVLSLIVARWDRATSYGSMAGETTFRSIGVVLVLLAGCCCLRQVPGGQR